MIKAFRTLLEIIGAEANSSSRASVANSSSLAYNSCDNSSIQSTSSSVWQHQQQYHLTGCRPNSPRIAIITSIRSNGSHSNSCFCTTGAHNCNYFKSGSNASSSNSGCGLRCSLVGGGVVCSSVKNNNCLPKCPVTSCNNMATHTHQQPSAQPFQGSRDRFGGVTVISEREGRDADTFESSLEVSLQSWQEEAVRGAWFHVHLDHAHWVPTLAKNGFEFHHGEGSLVVMVRWLPTDQPCAIPRYAHTVVGVGALVVRQETAEMLVVRERFYKLPHWKMPGGYVEPGEDLSVAAAREVLEETGVTAEFVSLIATRHTHAAAFTCSDLYFVVLMRPTTSRITMCTQELSACQWMKVEEYRKHPLVHETSRFFLECYLQAKERNVCISATPMYSSLLKRDQLIYSIDFANYVVDSSASHINEELEKESNESLRMKALTSDVAVSENTIKEQANNGNASVNDASDLDKCLTTDSSAGASISTDATCPTEVTAARDAKKIKLYQSCDGNSSRIEDASPIVK
uniref:Nudix hydrolase 7-like n=2 Tax=Hirondellea gigas TaxID=1518452 RepID=A0A2P2I2M5_9CRUS